MDTKRLVSLDAFRGFTMLLLLAEGAHLYWALLMSTPEGSFLHSFVIQFTHHPWNGLRFWDLVQPYFMFIVGAALPFAVAKRKQLGHSDPQILRHVLRRAFVLFLLGVGLHCVYAGELVWELWNVLTQLSFTYPLAYLLMRRRARSQVAVSVGLLLITELVYRQWAVPGFDQPFVKDHNFGAWMDMVLMGKINAGGGWVAINCIPTAAHTIWGVLAGQLLKDASPAAEKIKKLAVLGAVCLVAGYGLDPITPIIKRLATSSFVIVTGGWCLLTLAVLYWILDVRKRRGWAFPGVVVGMNSIFIYMLGETVVPQWVNPTTAIFTDGVFFWMGAGGVAVSGALVVLGLEWWLCYWLYRKGLSIKI